MYGHGPKGAWGAMGMAGLLATMACGQLTDLVTRDSHASQQETNQVIAQANRVNQDAENRQRQREAEAKKRREDEQQAKVKAAEDLHEMERIATEHRCTSTRAARVLEVKQAIQEYVSWGKENEPRAKYFDAHCQVYDSRGLKVSREHVADGVIVRTREVGTEYDVKCDGAPGRPKGIDANWYREISEMLEIGDAPLAGGDSHECAKLDAEALGTSLNVNRSDRVGRAKILALP